MGEGAFVRLVTSTAADTAVLETLRAQDDIEVVVSEPDGLTTDGGVSQVDCVVVDTDNVLPSHAVGPTQADGTPVIRCSVDPPEDADDGWVEVGTIAGRRTLVNRVRHSASPYEPAPAATDEALVDAVSVPGYVLDVRGRFVAVNDAFLALTSYERQAVLGSHASLTLTEAEDAVLSDSQGTAVRVNAAAGGAIECRRSAGIGVVSTDGESITRTVGTLRPRSDQPYIERDPAVLKRAIDAAHTPLSLSDPHSEDNPLVYVNDAFERTTGYDREDVLGRNCRFLQGEATDESAVEELRQAIEAERPVTVELTNYRKDGTAFWNRVTVTPIYDETGELVHFLGSQEEITEQKAVETELREQRDSLELINEMVRHDIRNDLQMMLMYLGEIAERTDGDVETFARRSRDTARNASELTRTARDLVETTLKSERDLEAVSLAPVLEAEVTKVRSGTDDAATFDADEPLPDVEVLADDILGSVFRNLLKNAVVHTDGDPTVTVGVSVAETVTVTVTDDGPGVPDERKETIFGREQASDDTGGSGIGLHLVEALTQHYRGDVWVADRPDGEAGAVFTVELKRAEAD